MTLMTAPPGLLTYSVTSTPGPLHTGLPGTIDIVVSNPDDTRVVSCYQVSLTLTRGNQVHDLLAPPTGTTPLPTATLLGDDRDKWVITADPQGAPIYRITPAGADPVPVTTAGLTVRLPDLPISERQGPATITVVETASADGPQGDTTIQLYADKQLRPPTPPRTAFWATLATITDNIDPGALPPVGEVLRHDKFTLVWKAYPRSTYRIRWNDDQSSDNSPATIKPWPSAGPPRYHYWDCSGVTRATSYVLSAVQGTLEAPIAHLTLTVPDPILDNVTVTGATQSDSAGDHDTVTRVTVTDTTWVNNTWTTSYARSTPRIDPHQLIGLDPLTCRMKLDPSSDAYALCDVFDTWTTARVTNISGLTFGLHTEQVSPGLALLLTTIIGELTITVNNEQYQFVVTPQEKPFAIALPQEESYTFSLAGRIRALVEDDNYYPISEIGSDDHGRLVITKVKADEKPTQATTAGPVEFRVATYAGAKGHLNTPLDPPGTPAPVTYLRRT